MLGKRSCRKYYSNVVSNRFPILKWFPKYEKSFIFSDVIAGITVGLTAVPQSMAYATVAGLTPEYGLYSSFVSCFLYVIFGSCRQMTIFPTALMTLLVFNVCGENYPACVALTTFYVGIFQIVMAFLQIGVLVSLISEPVTIGFTAGAAFTVAFSQIKNLLGLKVAKGRGFIEYATTLITKFTTLSPGDTTVGILCIVFLIVLKKIKEVKTENEILSRVLWYISLGRNAIIVIITAFIAFIWENPPFKLTGEVKGGFPNVAPPQFLLPPRDCVGNSTCDDLSFSDTWDILKQGPFVIAATAVLCNVAIAKSFGSGQTVDGTQEMFSLGILQVFGSFVGSIPTAGSFSRSAINEASGVKSTFGGIFSGTLVLLSLGFLTPSFYYIPKASLAAVIICAVVALIEYEALRPMWKISKLDVGACLVTFACSVLLGMEYGILVGVGASIITLLSQSLRPNLPMELKQVDGVQFYLLMPEERLNFPSVDFIQARVNKILSTQENCKTVALDLGKLICLDYSAATALSSLVKGLKKHDSNLVFLRVKPEFVEILEIAGLIYPVCYENEEDMVQHLTGKNLPKVTVSVPNPCDNSDVNGICNEDELK